MSNTAKGTIRVGCSGWSYRHWVGPGLLYPNARSAEWFRHYSHRYDTVELNNTFYRLPPVTQFKKWQADAPPGFIFSLKYSRYGTHMKRLRDPQAHVSVFLERIAPLYSVGPILVQLPPKFACDLERLRGFVDACLQLDAGNHDWVIEFRDPSWYNSKVFSLLQEKNVGVCIHDALGHLSMDFSLCTSRTVYVRFHGILQPRGRYTAPYLQECAQKVCEMAQHGKNVWVYFNNDTGGWALHNSADFIRDVNAHGGCVPLNSNTSLSCIRKYTETDTVNTGRH
eukprot:ANDGO_03163.mRNA.1 UPF0759 protein YunF